MKLESLFPVIATKAMAEARVFYVHYFDFQVVFETDWYLHLHGQRDGDRAPLRRYVFRPRGKHHFEQRRVLDRQAYNA